jgi:hypothetical protein
MLACGESFVKKLFPPGATANANDSRHVELRGTHIAQGDLFFKRALRERDTEFLGYLRGLKPCAWKAVVRGALSTAWFPTPPGFGGKMMKTRFFGDVSIGGKALFVKGKSLVLRFISSVTNIFRLRLRHVDELPSGLSLRVEDMSSCSVEALRT